MKPLHTPLLAAALAILPQSLPLFAQDTPELQRFEYTEPQMGTPFRIVIYGPDPNSAPLLARKAFDRIAQLNTVFSDYEFDSELNQLSRASGSGTPFQVTPVLYDILDYSKTLALESHGAFDVTAGPLTSLWRYHRRRQAFPPPDHLQDALSRSGHSLMILHPSSSSVELKTKNMQLDLGGVAKGYALDAAAEILRAAGLRRFMVHAGGDFVLGDPPPKQEGWVITIPKLDPAAIAHPASSFVLSNIALATSGDLVQFTEINGIRYSHILDPKTGVGLTNHSLVHVLAPSGKVADSLSTTISVLGPLEGLCFAQARPSIQASYFYWQEGKIHRKVTSGFYQAARETKVPPGETP